MYNKINTNNIDFLYRKHIIELGNGAKLCRLDLKTWKKLSKYGKIPKPNEIDNFITSEEFNISLPFLLIKSTANKNSSNIAVQVKGLKELQEYKALSSKCFPTKLHVAI